MTIAEYKREFIKAHRKADWKVETGPMDESGKYCKTYTFDDGAQMIEVNRPVWETAKVTATVKGISVEIEEKVKLFETEIWNTDDPKSVKFYEKW